MHGEPVPPYQVENLGLLWRTPGGAQEHESVLKRRAGGEHESGGSAGTGLAGRSGTGAKSEKTIQVVPPALKPRLITLPCWSQEEAAMSQAFK